MLTKAKVSVKIDKFTFKCDLSRYQWRSNHFIVIIAHSRHGQCLLHEFLLSMQRDLPNDHQSFLNSSPTALIQVFKRYLCRLSKIYPRHCQTQNTGKDWSNIFNQTWAAFQLPNVSKPQSGLCFNSQTWASIKITFQLQTRASIRVAYQVQTRASIRAVFRLPNSSLNQGRVSTPKRKLSQELRSMLKTWVLFVATIEHQNVGDNIRVVLVLSEPHFRSSKRMPN